MYYEFIFKPVNGHIEIYLNGMLQFTSDNMSEALKEVELMEE